MHINWYFLLIILLCRFNKIWNPIYWLYFFQTINRFLIIRIYLSDLLDGLLFSSVLGGSTAGLHRCSGHARSQHIDVGQNLETRYVLLQWQAELFAYDNDAQQIRATLPGRAGAVFKQVSEFIKWSDTVRTLWFLCSEDIVKNEENACFENKDKQSYKYKFVLKFRLFCQDWYLLILQMVFKNKTVKRCSYKSNTW